jgi:hypothetical protein
MANYIKVPMSSNPGRAMVTTVGALNASITTNQTGLTNQSATAEVFTTDGIGTGGVVELTVATNTVTVATASTAGDGYKVGDKLFFDATLVGGASGEQIIITLVADDLSSAFEGSEYNPYQLINADNIQFVKPVSATACELWMNEWDATAAAPLRWNITASGVPASDEYQLASDFALAIHEASSANNEVPEVVFYNSATIKDADIANS